MARIILALLLFAALALAAAAAMTFLRAARTSPAAPHRETTMPGAVRTFAYILLLILLLGLASGWIGS